jgi:hypothetical protein
VSSASGGLPQVADRKPRPLTRFQLSAPKQTDPTDSLRVNLSHCWSQNSLETWFVFQKFVPSFK